MATYIVECIPRVHVLIIILLCKKFIENILPFRSLFVQGSKQTSFRISNSKFYKKNHALQLVNLICSFNVPCRLRIDLVDKFSTFFDLVTVNLSINLQQ